jgi:hypothetical protein
LFYGFYSAALLEIIMESNFVYNEYVMGDADYYEDQEYPKQTWDYYELYGEEIDELDVSS